MHVDGVDGDVHDVGAASTSKEMKLCSMCRLRKRCSRAVAVAVVLCHPRFLPQNAGSLPFGFWRRREWR